MGEKRTHILKQIDAYLTRAETIKTEIAQGKKNESYHEKILIQDGSIGHSYETLFGRLFDSEVTSINVYDAYIRERHQVTTYSFTILKIVA